MTCKKGTNKESYEFCINAPYYQMLVQLFIERKTEVENVKNCDNFSSDKILSQNSSATQICKEFKFLYKSLSKYRGGKITEDDPFSEDDRNFLNYWLNDKLRNNNKDLSICVRETYDEIKNKDVTFFSKHRELENYLHVIDPDILENIKILYELYNAKQKIIDIMLNQDDSINKENLCQDNLENCHKKYRDGMNNCLNGYYDFYKALKLFEKDYKHLIEKVPDESEKCKYSEYFRLLEYDPVLEENQRRTRTYKIMSAPLLMLLAIPLLYKYTPFGPFLRSKIRMINDKWMNMNKNESELLSEFPDVEDNISDNGEYSLGYYSVTN
ncbi:PIR Superfamily Protein [Plasmodium ovale wallikeri]|uniref:PIR Superfamily Protein n=1 Tax=Plasmodium ovale wallikeri TaxID=864142 RepID=A0A1A9AIA1_PLAOA|nr:PIR Superfamily Protein [Plasmodium ovale wallikeri]SBT57163.1 PIR Superfamily Protein [Plasmodium ovale wallikeri]